MSRILFLLPFAAGVLVLIFRGKWIDASVASHRSFFGERGTGMQEKFARVFVPFVALGLITVAILGFFGIGDE